MDWYPFYFILYEQDTMHLTPYQDGCYRRLIDHYMKTRAALPDNDAALARIIGDSEANWVAMASPLLRPFFTAQDGRLYLKRCEEILDDQDNRASRLSESGRKGAEKRWRKNKGGNSHPIATPMGLNSTGQDRTLQSVTKVTDAPTPDWVPVSDWKDFLDSRKRLGKITERAKQLLLKDLEKLMHEGNDPALVLQQSIKRGWKGLFAIKGDDHGRQTQRQPTYAERADAAIQLGLDAIAERERQVLALEGPRPSEL